VIRNTKMQQQKHTHEVTVQHGLKGRSIYTYHVVVNGESICCIPVVVLLSQNHMLVTIVSSGDK